MSGGSVFLILALLSLSGLGICHKIADFYHCKASAISTLLFFWAAAVLWAYTLFQASIRHVGLFPPFTLGATGVALACGACAGIAILTFQVGIRYGRISTSWLVINLSTLVPAVLSLLIYKEWKDGIKWQQLVALGLMFASVVLLWRDKAREDARPQGRLSAPQAPIAADDRVRAAAGAQEQEA